MRIRTLMLIGCGVIGGWACQRGPAAGTGGAPQLSGVVALDGSSTVFPISEAVAEEFQKVYPGVRVTVGISGTGGGFKKFIAHDIDIAAASRPITAGEDGHLHAPHGAYIELPVAYDGISVLVHPKNSGVTALTLEELKRIWQPGSLVKLWSDVRPEWPNQPIRLYGPGTDSGTFDYFTEAVVGTAKSIRTDFTASEDDNVIAQGIAGDVYGLGYFGFAYWEANRTRVQAVAVDAGKGAVLPSADAIRTGAYPLARPLFIYVSRPALDRPEVAAFVQFYLEHAKTLTDQVGYVPLSDAAYRQATARLVAKTLGSAARTVPHGTSVESMLGGGAR